MAESYLPMEIQHHQLLFSVKDAIFDSGHLSFFCLLHFFFSLLACFNFISIFIFSLHLHRHLDSHPHFDLYPFPFFPQTVWYTLRGSYGESKDTGARSRRASPPAASRFFRSRSTSYMCRLTKSGGWDFVSVTLYRDGACRRARNWWRDANFRVKT